MNIPKRTSKLFAQANDAIDIYFGRRRKCWIGGASHYDLGNFGNVNRGREDRTYEWDPMKWLGILKNLRST